MQDLTTLTGAELSKLDYDLELESQHYEHQADVHGNDDGYYDGHQSRINKERDAIQAEWDRRETEGSTYDEMAEQAVMEMA